MARLVGGVILLFSLTACIQSGSGTIVSQSREVGAFDSIDVSDALDLVVTVDPTAETSVVVTFDDDLQDNVIAKVDGTTLELDVIGTVNFSGDDRFVEVVMSDLRLLSASGAVDVTATGAIDDLRLSVSGASDVDLSELAAERVDLNVSGASDVVVFAAEAVTGTVSGASDLVVLGDPVEVSVETSGASSLDVER